MQQNPLATSLAGYLGEIDLRMYDLFIVQGESIAKKF
jgi:hypothetical protein